MDERRRPLWALLLLSLWLAGAAQAARYQAYPAGMTVLDLDLRSIVVGYTIESDGSRRAIVGRYNANTEAYEYPLLRLPADAQDSVVAAIADGGSPRLLAGYYTDGNDVVRPLIWPWGVDIADPSAPEILPSLDPNLPAQALGVNQEHRVVGWALGIDGVEYPVYWEQRPVDPDNPENNEVAWQISRLPLPEGALGGRATGISPAGRVGGYAITGDGETVALLWEAGALNAQPRLLLDPNGRPARSTGLSGQFVSGWNENDDGTTRALRWRTLFGLSEVVAVLDGLEDTPAVALDVNARGEVVGRFETETGAQRAFYYSDLCGVFDLNRLLSSTDPFPDGGQWTLVEAFALNEASPPAIAALGEDAAGNREGFVLVPTDTSPVDLRASVRTDRDRVRVGEPLTYLIEVENVGSDYATCVVVRNELYIGVTLLGVRADRGRCQAGVDFAQCVVDELQPGERLTMQVRTTPRHILVDREIVNRVRIIPGENDLSPEDSLIETRTPVPREGCFIATAAYGSYLAPEVARLRTWRDQVLAPHPWGRALVDLYYRLSPPLAAWLADHPEARPWVRAALTPVVWGVTRPGWALAGLGGALLVWFGLRRRRRQMR